MVSSPKPPAAPDPVTTAKAQGEVNREAAITQAGLNMVNQVTPWGNLTYNQVGEWSPASGTAGTTGATGTTGSGSGSGATGTTGANATTGLSTPRYEAVTTLSPEQQALLDQQNEFDKKFNTIALAQTDRIGGVLSQPVSLDNTATEARLMELGRQRLDPVLNERRSQTESNLANRGIYSGSTAYERAMRDLGQQENDAYNQLMLSGRGQAVQEALTERNQPINEITALMSGSQVQAPQFNNTPQQNVQPADYQGAVQNKFANDMAIYNAKQQSQNQLLGGLMGLGGKALGFGLGKFF